MVPCRYDITTSHPYTIATSIFQNSSIHQHHVLHALENNKPKGSLPFARKTTTLVPLFVVCFTRYVPVAWFLLVLVEPLLDQKHLQPLCPSWNCSYQAAKSLYQKQQVGTQQPTRRPVPVPKSIYDTRKVSLYSRYLYRCNLV